MDPDDAIYEALETSRSVMCMRKGITTNTPADLTITQWLGDEPTEAVFRL